MELEEEKQEPVEPTCSNCKFFTPTEIYAGDDCWWGKCSTRPTLFHEPHSGAQVCHRFEWKEK